MTGWEGGMSARIAALNQRLHRQALNAFMFIVVAHWAEHLVQAYQIWVLDRPRPASRGALGQFFPWLFTSEWLHYGYALVMIAGLVLLQPGFVGRARFWWTVALVIQFWHHIEHLRLLIQAQTHVFFFGGTVPTSVAQIVFPRGRAAPRLTRPWLSLIAAGSGHQHGVDPASAALLAIDGVVALAVVVLLLRRPPPPPSRPPS